MDKIINILLLIIIFVFDPLAISLVIAANFAFDQANKKNIYGEFEDEIEPDLWDDLPYDEEDTVTEEELTPEPNDLPVINPEEVKPEDWKVVEEDDTELPEPKPVKIIQKGPSTHRVLFNDGSERKVKKDDNIIRYL